MRFSWWCIEIHEKARHGAMNKIGLHRSQHVETASLSYLLYTDHSNPATRGTYCSFIFRGNNPYFSGLKPSFFMIFRVQRKILLSERQQGGVRVSDTNCPWKETSFEGHVYMVHQGSGWKQKGWYLRIIPVSKWLITMVIVSSLNGVIPLINGLNGL